VANNGNGRMLRPLSDVERLSQLEADYRGLRSDVQKLGVSFDEFVRDMRDIIREKDKAPWGVLGTWAGALLIFIGTVGTLVISPIREELTEQDRADEHILTSLNEHKQELGHTGIQAKLEGFDHRISTNEDLAKELTKIDREELITQTTIGVNQKWFDWHTKQYLPDKFSRLAARNESERRDIQILIERGQEELRSDVDQIQADEKQNQFLEEKAARDAQAAAEESARRELRERVKQLENNHAQILRLLLEKEERKNGNGH